MCRDFMDGAITAGWATHPETFDFDIVLVSPSGQRFGVEAKLAANVGVLAQATKTQRFDFVHCRAVLVPKASPEFRRVARRLKVLVFQHWGLRDRWFGYELATVERLAVGDYVWMENPSVQLPTVAIYQEAGLPAPRRLTPWKLRAVRFCLENADRCFTREDFQRAGLSPTLWVKSGWIQPTGQARSSKGRPVTLYRLVEAAGRPDRKYPEVVAGLVAEQNTM